MVATTTNPIADGTQAKKPVPAVGGSLLTSMPRPVVPLSSWGTSPGAKPLTAPPAAAKPATPPATSFGGDWAGHAGTVAGVGGSLLHGLVGQIGQSEQPGGPTDAAVQRPVPGIGGMLGQLLKPQVNVATASPSTPAPPAAATPAPAAAPPRSSAPANPTYGDTSTFGPGSDLRNTQILPGQTADRYGIAQQRYNQFLQDAAPGEFDSIRAVRQAAGGAGTLGSGMAAKGFADLGARIEQAHGSALNTFLGNALEGTIGDQANQRQELRTERGYQGDTAQRSIDNARQQQLDEEALTNGQFNRDEQRANDIASIGYRNNPAGDILTGASGQQGAADQSGDSLAELLRQYAYGRSTMPPSSGYPPGYGGDSAPADSIPLTTKLPQQQPYQLPIRY